MQSRFVTNRQIQNLKILNYGNSTCFVFFRQVGGLNFAKWKCKWPWRTKCGTGKVEAKLSLHIAITTFKIRRVLPPLILNLRAWRKWEVNITSRPLVPKNKHRCSCNRRLGLPQSRYGRFWRTSFPPTANLPPDRPVHTVRLAQFVSECMNVKLCKHMADWNVCVAEIPAEHEMYLSWNSAVGIASRYSWTVRGSNPGRSEIFRTLPERPWGPHSLLYNG